jgi:hypothetical protein
MKTLLYNAATVLVSIPALAQDKTLDPNGITVDVQRAPFAAQRSAAHGHPGWA